MITQEMLLAELDREYAVGGYTDETEDFRAVMDGRSVLLADFKAALQLHKDTINAMTDAEYRVYKESK